MNDHDRLAELAGRLEALAEDLADLALDRLRSAADPDSPGSDEAAVEERRITRARRSVVKAVALLGGVAGDEDP